MTMAPTATPAPEELVTVIITTSPTPSAPSTELLEQIAASFRKHCQALVRCRVIVVLDTYDHVSTKPRLKKGHVTPDGASKYADYKANAKRLILKEYSPTGRPYGHGDLARTQEKAEFGSGAAAYASQDNTVVMNITTTKDGRVKFVEPVQRLGFGLAVRSALRMTVTPYVWIQQHDWALVTDIPLGPMLQIMHENRTPATKGEEEEKAAGSYQATRPPVEYICFASIRMMEYATSDHVMHFPALRGITQLHKQNFTVQSMIEGGGIVTSRIPLTPFFHWHDKPHLASTSHYLDQVFYSRIAIQRGAFIEDTVGHVARDEMKEGNWKKWASWLYYPGEGKHLCLRHLKGRTWRGVEAELAAKLEYMRLNGLDVNVQIPN
ncbi:hypothetical protein QBC40DRAFT_282305 [Triangularia verruculosa]|uniref:Uncharacterized protein n=1 Tax=Triangularia verruculosa TaxID=2587418 RepID=A0AAN7AU04_9PEZI|nr:hypothetical protein QBC40DRAFT_282305 [Triangularia verruculosa]